MIIRRMLFVILLINFLSNSLVAVHDKQHEKIKKYITIGGIVFVVVGFPLLLYSNPNLRDIFLKILVPEEFKKYEKIKKECDAKINASHQAVVKAEIEAAAKLEEIKKKQKVLRETYVLEMQQIEKKKKKTYCYEEFRKIDTAEQLLNKQQLDSDEITEEQYIAKEEQRIHNLTQFNKMDIDQKVEYINSEKTKNL